MADTNNSVRLHRVLKGPAERVYRAFLEPDALAKWLPPYGFICKVHEMDARVGGKFRMSFTNFSTGQWPCLRRRVSGAGTQERIVYTDKFDDPNLPGEIESDGDAAQKSFAERNSCRPGNIPAMIPAEMCYLGWQESLANSHSSSIRDS